MASIWTRKRDLAYVVYFALHIPILLLIDLVPMYPATLVPAVSHTLRRTNIEQFKDQFFISPPAWFDFYVYMEVFHLPLSVWALYQLLRARPSPQTPLVLLVYALQTFLTTATCIADMLAWDKGLVTQAEKMSLLGLYGPYAAVAAFMAVDCYGRVGSVLRRTDAALEKKTV